MYKSILFLILLTLIAIHGRAQDCIGSNYKERRVLKIINSLPEVIQENKTRRKNHIPFMLRAYLQNKPTEKDIHYYVTISEEKDGRLFTYDWYKVNSHTYHVSYYDMINNKTISLNAWRRQIHNR